MSPALAAVCKYEPRPGRRKSRFPNTNISQAIRKNQPPATDIMEFHTSPIAEYGSSICVNLCHQLQRYISATSRISRGILFSEEEKLKVMFQTCPVKIKRKDPSSS